MVYAPYGSSILVAIANANLASLVFLGHYPRALCDFTLEPSSHALRQIGLASLLFLHLAQLVGTAVPSSGKKRVPKLPPQTPP